MQTRGVGAKEAFTMKIIVHKRRNTMVKKCGSSAKAVVKPDFSEKK